MVLHQINFIHQGIEIMQTSLSPKMFKELRNSYGFSQAKIARDLDIQRSYISQFENGRYYFSEDELNRIENYLVEFNQMDEGAQEIILGADLITQNETAISVGTEMENCLSAITHLLEKPVPRFLIFFEDDEGLSEMKEELLMACLAFAKLLAEAMEEDFYDCGNAGCLGERVNAKAKAQRLPDSAESGDATARVVDSSR